MSSKISGNVNLYDLLGVDIDADQAAIRKAYRKKALDCHPDKNPDNPKATELFHQLSGALEILTDPTARAAFDKVLKAKKAAELRNKQLDSKRQKLKAELENREKEALKRTQVNAPYSTVAKSDEEILQDQIERLRREGSKLLEEEQRLMREQLQRTMLSDNVKKEKCAASADDTQHRIKIKWKADKNDSSNGGYTKDKLNGYLKKYGDINALVMSNKAGRALVEFQSRDAAEMALAYEKGSLDNPLQLSWVNSEQAKAEQTSVKITESAREFEDLVMRKLRQAEERRRLIEQMQKEDAEEV